MYLEALHIMDLNRHRSKGCLELSFTETPVLNTARRCRIFAATPGSPSPSLLWVVVCRYCNGLYQQHNKQRSDNDGFVCEHCFKRINEEVDQTNCTPIEKEFSSEEGGPRIDEQARSDFTDLKTALVHLRESIERRDALNEIKLAGIFDKIDSLTKESVINDVQGSPNFYERTKEQVGTCDASTQTEFTEVPFVTKSNSSAWGSEFQLTSQGCDTVQPSQAKLEMEHAVENLPSYSGQQLAGKFSKASARNHKKHDSSNPADPPVKSVLIAGGSNVGRLGETVGTMLGGDSRFYIASQTGAMLSQVIANVRRHIALYSRGLSDQLIILHAGLDDVLGSPVGIDISAVWSSIEEQLDKLSEFCDEKLIRLSVCSIPVVTGGPGRDRRSDCQYINTKMETKFKSTAVFLEIFHTYNGLRQPCMPTEYVLAAGEQKCWLAQLRARLPTF